MEDSNIDPPLAPRKFVFEKEPYKGYISEYVFGWVWEIEKDDEYYHKGAAISEPTAIRNIKSMINVFLCLSGNNESNDENKTDEEKT